VALADLGEPVPQVLRATALRGRAGHRRAVRFDQPAVRVGDHQLHARRPGLLQGWLAFHLWDEVLQEGCQRAQEVPAECKRDVVRVARRGDLSQAEVAADFDVSVESVRRWVRQADVDDGVVDGQTSSEQNELVQLRREKRRLEMVNEILRRAAAYFAAGSLPE
jgi:transposase